MPPPGMEEGFISVRFCLQSLAILFHWNNLEKVILTPCVSFGIYFKKNYGLSECVLYVGRNWTREACPWYGDRNVHGERPLSAQRGEDSDRVQSSDPPPQRELPTRKGPDPGQADGLQTPVRPAGVMASSPRTVFPIGFTPLWWPRWEGPRGSQTVWSLLLPAGTASVPVFGGAPGHRGLILSFPSARKTKFLWHPHHGPELAEPHTGLL